MSSIEKRMEVERQVVRHLIRTAKKHGYAVTKVYDGEDMEKVADESQAMEVVFSVDECHIYFKHPEEPKAHCVFIVLGNDGWDAICDSSMGGKWDAVMDECSEYADQLGERGAA